MHLAMTLCGNVKYFLLYGYTQQFFCGHQESHVIIINTSILPYCQQQEFSKYVHDNGWSLQGGKGWRWIPIHGLRFSRNVWPMTCRNGGTFLWYVGLHQQYSPSGCRYLFVKYSAVEFGFLVSYCQTIPQIWKAFMKDISQSLILFYNNYSWYCRLTAGVVPSCRLIVLSHHKQGLLLARNSSDCFESFSPLNRGSNNDSK